MKYIKTIFENENIQNLALENEELIKITTNTLIDFNIALELMICGGIGSYIVENDLNSTYANIVNKVVEENVNLIEVFSDILKTNYSAEDRYNLTLEALDIAKNMIWEQMFPSIVMSNNNTAVYTAASSGILGTDAKSWADDAADQIMSNAATSKEGTSGDLQSAVTSTTTDSSNPLRTRVGDSLSTNVSTDNKMKANLPKDGGPVKSGSITEGYNHNIIKEALGIGGKTVIGEPGSSVYSRGKLNKVIDPAVSKSADHLTSSSVGKNAKSSSKETDPNC